MAKEKIKDEDSELAQNFNFFSLMKFVFPSIFAFVFIALYQMVDGFFIQEFVGDLAIATVNLYLPILYLFIESKFSLFLCPVEILDMLQFVGFGLV